MSSRYTIFAIGTYINRSTGKEGFSVWKGFLSSQPFKVGLNKFWFGSDRLPEGQRIFLRWNEKARRRRHCSQTTSIFNFTDFYRGRNFKRKKETGKDGKREEKRENRKSFKLDKVRENQDCWTPFRIGSSLFTRIFIQICTPLYFLNNISLVGKCSRI